MVAQVALYPGKRGRLERSPLPLKVASDRSAEAFACQCLREWVSAARDCAEKLLRLGACCVRGKCAMSANRLNDLRAVVPVADIIKSAIGLPARAKPCDGRVPEPALQLVDRRDRDLPNSHLPFLPAC